MGPPLSLATRSDVQIPKRWVKAEDFELEVSYFRMCHANLKQAEDSGIVPGNIPVETVLAAWSLRRQQWRIKDPSLKGLILNAGLIARKYGLTKIWTARYHDTLRTRLEKYLAKLPDGLKARSFCGRCGRPIWNPQSVRQGRGPVCIHKRDH